jgi:hypothetical protein
LLWKHWEIFLSLEVSWMFVRLFEAVEKCEHLSEIHRMIQNWLRVGVANPNWFVGCIRIKWQNYCLFKLFYVKKRKNLLISISSSYRRNLNLDRRWAMGRGLVTPALYQVEMIVLVPKRLGLKLKISFSWSLEY